MKTARKLLRGARYALTLTITTLLGLSAWAAPPAKSVLDTPLAACSTNPMTGFYRTGTCLTGPEDRGTHVVCAKMTEAFLTFTRSRGNDLSTPAPQYRFPGLKPGDKWCLCALRYKEAREAGVAPSVDLAATHSKALEFMPREHLRPSEPSNP